MNETMTANVDRAHLLEKERDEARQQTGAYARRLERIGRHTSRLEKAHVRTKKRLTAKVQDYERLRRAVLAGLDAMPEIAERVGRGDAVFTELVAAARPPKPRPAPA